MGTFGTSVNSNLTITIPVGAISTNTLSSTIQGFLLSGSLTTDSGIGDNVGVVGAQIKDTSLAAAPAGTYSNLPTISSGAGTGMTVQIFIGPTGPTTLGSFGIQSGGSGYAIGDTVTIQQSILAGVGVTIVAGQDLVSLPLTAADLTGGGTPYMVNFNPSPVETDPNVDTVTVNQKLLIGGPQLALYHAYNTTVSSSLYNTNLNPSIKLTPDAGAGTLLWTTAGSDPANSNNYMTWAPDGSDAESYQDTNIPFLLERGDIIRVEGIKNLADTATNSSRSVNIIEDFIVEGIIPYYYSSSFDTGQQDQQSLDGYIQRTPTPLIFSYLLGADPQTTPTLVGGNFTTTGNNYNFTTFIGGPLPANGNPGRIQTLNNYNFSSAGNYLAGESYATTDGSGTGATMRILSTNPPSPATGQPVTAIIDNPGTGYVIGEVLEFKTPGAVPPLGAQGATADVSAYLDTKCTLIRNGVTLTDWDSLPASPGGGGKIVIESDDAAGYFPGFMNVTLSEGYGFLPGDIIHLDQSITQEAGGWYPDNFAGNLPAAAPGTSDLTITIAFEIMGNTSFNNNFTVGVDVGAPDPTTFTTPTGSQPGYHLYERGEVGFTADTFIQVSPDPNITLKGLLLGEVKKFTVRRQIEADDKVMLENITPPSGSRGVDTPSGQGFLIPNDFSKVQKANALNIINQLKAKNAFDKPIEPGITKS